MAHNSTTLTLKKKVYLYLESFKMTERKKNPTQSLSSKMSTLKFFVDMSRKNVPYTCLLSLDKDIIQAK